MRQMMPKPLAILLTLTLANTVTLGASPTKLTPQKLQFFESKIRPVLIKTCYKCHAASSNKIKGKLQLDTRAGLLKGGESGPALIPGHPEKSLLIKAIRHDSPMLEMPPKSKLSPSQIADFEAWIKMGAPDPRDGRAKEIIEKKIDYDKGRQFWSFQPLKNYIPPKVKNTTWVKSPVDNFILARLEKEQIAPNQTAPRITLIRRAYFALWGLPPTPQQVADFLNDQSPDAYTELIDRLLAGQHYGERWARHWLDLARFAESNGYAFDKDRNAAYHYRDFVIKALNQDMPYNQFIRLQIAGDQINPDDYMAHAATGFIAAGPFTSQQTQKERERSRYEQLDDVIHTLGTATLGLTIGCARCHDHKFDPISANDYYRMIANFAQTGFDDYKYNSNPKEHQAALAAYNAAHKPLVALRTAYEKEKLPATLAIWIKNRPKDVVRPKLSPWQTVGPFTAASFDKAYDTSFGPERKIILNKPVGKAKLKWKPQPNWADGKVHNVFTGTNAANYLFRTIEVPAAGPAEISIGRDDAVRVYLNRRQVLAQKVTGGVAPDQAKVKLNLKAGKNELVIKIINASGPSGFYFKLLDGDPPKNIQKIIDLPAAKRNAQQKQQLLKWFAPYDPQWVKLNNTVKAHQTKVPKPKIIPIFSARKGGATYNFGADTRKVYFLTRGNSNQKKGLASPGYSRVLMSSPNLEKQWLNASSKDAAKSLPPRVAMANWITDHRQGAGHLLARVIVNRLWKHHMGQGIVRTPSDFGTQGERPTHPQLLDYLATKLIQNGWKLKPIHKLILTSNVYMQAGHTTPAGIRKDIENKLWWRRPALRLEAEPIRDALLAVSGTLDTKMFGPGSLNQADKRRSVYLKVKRSALIPILQLFDAPNALQSIGQRNITTVPPQALAMMNSPYIRQVAASLAKRVRPSTEAAIPQIITDAYHLALSRPPTASEISTMTNFINQQTASYGNNPKAFDTAITDFCQLVLCLNEFMFVD